MKRLEAVFSLISPCEVFADIGTDHGQIAQFAAGVCSRVIATDISELCLNKARQNIAADNVEFVAGDGLKPLKTDPQQIAICGMGGRTIIDIISGYGGSAALILQPQTDAELLRRFLCGNGYTITHDITAFEGGVEIHNDLSAYAGGKYYDIIKAVRDTPACCGESDISVNPNKGEPCDDKHDDLAFRFGMFYKTPNKLLRNRLYALKQKYEGYKQCEKNIKILTDLEVALYYQK